MSVWTCPKCGRSFKKQNQSHYCGKKPATIDEYILAQSEEIRPQLEAVRNAIRKALPDAEERMSWSMPTYWQGSNIIHFAANRNHLGVYAGTEAVEAFSEKLAGFKTSKGSIHFPYTKTIPLELIAEIARWCLQTGNHP